MMRYTSPLSDYFVCPSLVSNFVTTSFSWWKNLRRCLTTADRIPRATDKSMHGPFNSTLLGRGYISVRNAALLPSSAESSLNSFESTNRDKDYRICIGSSRVLAIMHHTQSVPRYTYPLPRYFFPCVSSLLLRRNRKTRSKTRSVPTYQTTQRYISQGPKRNCFCSKNLKSLTEDYDL
jgi:hypothetical protein